MVEASWNTDKIEPHGYLPDYLRLADELGPAATVCELGVLYGGSLDMFKSLFPDSPALIGVDWLDSSIWPEGTVKIVASQDDPELGAKVREHAPDGCDLIVDDASHRGRLTAASFIQLWPLVKPGGYYVVEDCADDRMFPAWPRPESDALWDWVHNLTGALDDGAQTVTYTREGLVIIRRCT